MIGFWVLQVDFLMGYVHITADDNRFALIQFIQMSTEGIFPSHAVVQTEQTVFGVWSVDINKEEILELQSDDAAFLIVFFDSKTIPNGQRFFFGEDGNTGIALFHSTVPVLMVAGSFNDSLFRLHFGFAQTENISILLLEKVVEAFGDAGAQTIYVPGNQFHSSPPCILKIIIVVLSA